MLNECNRTLAALRNGNNVTTVDDEGESDIVGK